MLEIWSLVPRPLRNPACSAGSSRSRIGRSLSLMMCSRILLWWEINAIVLLFLHLLTSPFLGSVRKVEFFQSAGHLFVFQILLQRCWITFAPDSSAYLISSAGISSGPGDLLFLRCWMALVTSDRSMSGSSSQESSSALSETPSVSCEAYSSSQ